MLEGQEHRFGQIHLSLHTNGATHDMRIQFYLLCPSFTTEKRSIQDIAKRSVCDKGGCMPSWENRRESFQRVPRLGTRYTSVSCEAIRQTCTVKTALGNPCLTHSMHYMRLRVQHFVYVTHVTMHHMF